MSLFGYKINNKLRASIVAIAIILSLSVADNAKAQCITQPQETQFVAASLDIATNLTNFTNQENNYIRQSYSAVQFAIEKELREFRENTINWLSDWAVNRLKPFLGDMMQQMKVNYDEQALLISKVIDAQSINEHYLEKDRARIDAYRRYEPSPTSAIIDTFGPALLQGYQVTKASGYSLIKTEMELLANNEDTDAKKGMVGVLKPMFDDYEAFLCHPTAGDVGCNEGDTDITYSGKHRDLGQLLWGPRKSIDMSQKENRKLLRYVMRYFVYPQVDNPVPKTAIENVTGKEILLKRRSATARLNTVYYALSQMLGDRIGNGGKSDSAGKTMAEYVEEIRAEADVDINDISQYPSYREVNETLNRDRFLMPDYFIGLSTQSSEQVLREQVTLGALRLQMMNDLYRRQEEMLLMSASDYSRYLDNNMPQPPIGALPTDNGANP